MEKVIKTDHAIFNIFLPECNESLIASAGKKQEFSIPVSIPLEENVEEFVCRIFRNYNIPNYYYDDIFLQFKKFVEVESVRHYDILAENKIKEFKSDNFEIDSVVKYWEKLFRNENVEYSNPLGTTDEELFSVVYHKLVHSSALESILQNEQAYATKAGAIAEKRKQQMSKLSERQNDEMAAAVQELHNMTTEPEIIVSEKDINNLAAKHFEEQCLTSGRLNSEVEALHQNQKKEYRAWLMAMFEKEAINPSSYSLMPERMCDNFANDNLSSNHEPWPLLEESFTIHLGSQMKQMHNVRILSANILNFCKIKLHKEAIYAEPQRIGTALALYSSSLSGIVLLEDVGSLDGFTGLAKDFFDVCQYTTEFHFDNIENQLETIKSQVKDAVLWRTQKSKFNYQQSKKCGRAKKLQAGDLYITKHSNLSQAHVVFHLLVDDSIKSSDMNSRHPVILGLRNIIKTAASFDVTTITLPLLLMNEMSEEMTVAWCSKRAELIFKCVKGFMIEAAGVGGADIVNLQLLVPSGISAEVFSTLATMLPSIFRVSNPLVVKNSSDSQKII